MEKQNLKLRFIENGRLSDGEMHKIAGGWTCHEYIKCEEGLTGKSSCGVYYNCGLFGKKDCTVHEWVVGDIGTGPGGTITPCPQDFYH